MKALCDGGIDAKYRSQQVYDVVEKVRRLIHHSTCYRLAVCFLLSFLVLSGLQTASASDAERNLVEELFDRQNYNPMIRPVKNLSQTITVRFELSLIQLIMLDERNQIMKSNIWLRLVWYDYQLQWDKDKYDNIETIRILPDRVWKPDIVLFNNADGRFEVSFKANVLVNYDSSMMWIPCAIYKSSCDIDVKFFPFDEQSCQMIFGSWTYDGDEVNLTQYTPGFLKVDLTDYEKSGSWDVVNVIANLTDERDKESGRMVSRAKYTIKMRRKTLFYTVNLIIPSVLVSSLSMVVFYLPATAGERITMSVSILLALVVYLQVLVTNILPPSSISLPLYAKYLLFTVIIDVCCIANTVIVLNCNFKTPRTHQMSRWVRVLFMKWLPRLLLMQRPGSLGCNETSGGFDVSVGHLPTQTPDTVRRGGFCGTSFEPVDVHHPECSYRRISSLKQRQKASEAAEMAESPPPPSISPEINKAIEAVRFVGAHLKNEDDFGEVVDDWRYVSLVIDRMLFFTYMLVSVVATCSILIKTPIFDTFNQQEYKKLVANERLCRDPQTPYEPSCIEYYPILCNSEWWKDLFTKPCPVWRNVTQTMNEDELYAP